MTLPSISTQRTMNVKVTEMKPPLGTLYFWTSQQLCPTLHQSLPLTFYNEKCAYRITCGAFVLFPLSESIFNGHRALQIHISSNTFIISSFTPAHLSPSFPSSMCYFKGVYPQSNVCVCVCDQRFRGWWRPTRTACLRSSCMAPPMSLPSSAG